MQAVQIADISGDTRLAKLTGLLRVEALWLICRFEEAAKLLEEVGDVVKEEDAVLCGYYFLTRAMVSGSIGDAEESYEYFEMALELTKKELDPYRVANIWLRYGLIAKDLGDCARTKACFEHALFVALQYRIPWMIGQLRLQYAYLLACMGQPANSYPYLLEALSSSPSIPLLDIYRALLGIPLALKMQNPGAIVQCADPRALDLAFQSEMPDLIGGAACAFAKLYVSQGRLRAARVLLRRALDRIPDGRFNLDILLATAQYGAVVDIPRAQALLEIRIAQPHSALFQAGFALFTALVQQRRGATVQACKHAKIAVMQFEALQWYGYAEVARSILPGGDAVTERTPTGDAPFSTQPALTAREREVTALVLRGFTNRDIANELNIALHTVEKHMNSIMNNLGVRSRYQMADLLEPVIK